MYKAYRAYIGSYPDDRKTVEDVLAEINLSNEEIVSCTPVGEGHFRVLIITKETN